MMHPGMHALDPNALIAAQMGQMHLSAASAGNNIGPHLIDDRVGGM